MRYAIYEPFSLELDEIARMRILNSHTLQMISYVPILLCM
jgi:hypothetical protein